MHALLRQTTRRLTRPLSAAAASAGESAAVTQLQQENALLRLELASMRSGHGHGAHGHNRHHGHNGEPQPEVSKFVGATSEYTTDMKFYRPMEDAVARMPCFRLMDDLGRIVPGAERHVPELPREFALACMATMLRVSEFDKIFLDAQRQGRIAFYLTSRGEESAAVGTAAALQEGDWALPQYRELGLFFWRGFSFIDVANQLVANEKDPAHGRQLPLHIGSRERRILYVKSTLGTQCPHASGVAFAMKRAGGQHVSIVYFGEGSASHGDIPSALNIAAVHKCPTIFFCRNNGYAISTRATDQYVSDGIAQRGPAFGLPTIRIDGNDILAVIAATRKAREITLTEGRPVLIEAMSYRIGAHSTSDDDSKYRQKEAPEAGWDSERAYWEARSPCIRLGRYLASKGWYNVQMEEAIRSQARREAIESLNEAQAVDKPAARHLFTDVYDETSWMQDEQQAALAQHIADYKPHYMGSLSDKQLEGL